MKNFPLPSNPSRASILTSSKSPAPQDPSPKSSQSKTDKRSKLHVSSVVHWLRKRHHDTANLNYLMLPSEQKQHSEVQDVFKIFDADNSGKLALGEFYDMLQHANITIDKEDLKQFYKKVDMDNDIALDFQEFKNCTLSDEANFHFAKMMEKMRIQSRSQDPAKEPEKPAGLPRKDNSAKSFKPRTFGNLLNYLTYENKKQSLKDFVKNSENDLGEKFKKFGELLDLHMGKDIYAERLSSRFEHKWPNVERGSIVRNSSFRSYGFKAPQVDSEAAIADQDTNRVETVSDDESSNSDERKEVEEPELLKELAEIAANARKTAKEEFFVRTRKDKRQTHVVVTSSAEHSKRPSLIKARDSVLSNKASTRNLDDNKQPHPLSQFSNKRLLTAEDKPSKFSIGLGGIHSNERLDTSPARDEIVIASTDYPRNFRSTQSPKTVKLHSSEKIATWTSTANTPKKGYHVKDNSIESHNRIVLPKFRGSLLTKTRTEESPKNIMRVRLASPQGFLGTAREDSTGPRADRSPKFFTPSSKIKARRINYGESSSEKEPLNFSQHLSNMQAPPSTDRERIAPQQLTPNIAPDASLGSTRSSFRMPSKMPKNYSIGTELGSLSSRSYRSQRPSKPNTPSHGSHEREITKEKSSRVSIFAKPMPTTSALRE